MKTLLVVALVLAGTAVVADEMADNYARFGARYGVWRGVIVADGSDGISRLSGVVLSVAASNLVLISSAAPGRSVVALRVPSTDRLTDDQRVSVLARDGGEKYVYASVAGAQKHVRLLDYVRPITLAEWRAAGPRAFPEIAEAAAAEERATRALELAAARRAQDEKAAHREAVRRMHEEFTTGRSVTDR